MVRHVTIAIVVAALAPLEEIDTAQGQRRSAPTSTTAVVESNPVSLGNGDYVLVARNGRELSLQLTQAGQTAVWKIVPRPLHSDVAALPDRWGPDGVNARITEITLTRWSRPSLLAAVKVSRGRETVFWCLSFPHVIRSTEGTEELRPKAVALLKGGPEDRVLALSGSANSPAITLVTGKISKNEPGKIEAGAIAFEWCGSPEHARVGRFQPDYAANSQGEAEHKERLKSPPSSRKARHKVRSSRHPHPVVQNPISRDRHCACRPPLASEPRLYSPSKDRPLAGGRLSASGRGRQSACRPAA